jgi:hypothetical protein
MGQYVPGAGAEVKRGKALKDEGEVSMSDLFSL